MPLGDNNNIIGGGGGNTSGFGSPMAPKPMPNANVNTLQGMAGIPMQSSLGSGWNNNTVQGTGGGIVNSLIGSIGSGSMLGKGPISAFNDGYSGAGGKDISGVLPGVSSGVRPYQLSNNEVSELGNPFGSFMTPKPQNQQPYNVNNPVPQASQTPAQGMFQAQYRNDVGGYNPLQYATNDTASQLAAMLGGNVTSTPWGLGPFNIPPQNQIEFGNGRQLNAGLLADRYSRYPREVADAMTRAELGYVPGQSYGGANSNTSGGAVNNNLPQASPVNTPQNTPQNNIAQAIRSILSPNSGPRYNWFNDGFNTGNNPFMNVPLARNQNISQAQNNIPTNIQGIVQFIQSLLQQTLLQQLLGAA